MTDEKSILEQFAAGNHTAFRELFMRYHLKVYYFVLGLVKSGERCRGLDPRDFPKALDASESFHGSEDVRFLPLCAGEAYGVQLYRIPPGESRELGECFGGRRGAKYAL